MKLGELLFGRGREEEVAMCTGDTTGRYDGQTKTILKEKYCLLKYTSTENERWRVLYANQFKLILVETC